MRKLYFILFCLSFALFGAKPEIRSKVRRAPLAFELPFEGIKRALINGDGGFFFLYGYGSLDEATVLITLTREQYEALGGRARRLGEMLSQHQFWKVKKPKALEYNHIYLDVKIPFRPQDIGLKVRFLNHHFGHQRVIKEPVFFPEDQIARGTDGEMTLLISPFEFGPEKYLVAHYPHVGAVPVYVLGGFESSNEGMLAVILVRDAQTEKIVRDGLIHPEKLSEKHPLRIPVGSIREISEEEYRDGVRSLWPSAKIKHIEEALKPYRLTQQDWFILKPPHFMHPTEQGFRSVLHGEFPGLVQLVEALPKGCAELIRMYCRSWREVKD